VPGALRGVQPGSLGVTEVVCFGARGPADLRLGFIDFGVSWVKGVQCTLFVFPSLGSGIRCQGLVWWGAAGDFVVVASADTVRAWVLIPGVLCCSGPEASRDMLQRVKQS